MIVQGAIHPNGTVDEEGDPADAEASGTFRRWGWTYDGSAESGNGSVVPVGDGSIP